MKKVLSLVLVLAMVLGSFSFVFAASNDVAGTVYEDAVARLSLLGILTGYPDGTFKPENQITRAEFAAVAIRAKGLEASAQASKGLATGFKDVPAGHWASGYVGTAAKLGIVNGVGNGQFAPEAPVKYEEAITMLVRALGYEEAAKQKGGYPYGYLIVANENGLLDEVKGTQGAPATRGIVAQLTDNALEIPMMIQVGYGTNTKWVVSGSKEHGDNAEERYLLDDMGFDSIKGRVISVTPKTNKLTVQPKEGKNVTLKVSEGFDLYAVEGLTTKFWYRNETVVVHSVKEEAKFDAVEYDKDEKEIKLVTEDENYEVASKATLYVDGKEVAAKDFTADYAKVVLNDDDEIIWAQGYTLDGFVLVEEVKDNIAYGFDEYDELKVKDFLVVKEGKTIGVDGIEEGDILFYNVEEKFAVVSNNGTEGKLERVYTTGSTAFRFDGAGYANTSLPTSAIYFDEGKVGDLNSDILKDFLDDEVTVTVYVDFAGDVVVVAGEVSTLGNSAYAVLLEKPVEYSGRKGSMLALDLRNGANEKVSYDLVKKDINGKDIKLTRLADADAVKALEKGTVLKLTIDKDGDVTGIELPESEKLGKAFGVKDANAKDTYGTSYRLQASTVVFYDSNKKAIALGNVDGQFKEVKANSTIYHEKGRVVAVVADTDADADTKNVTGLVTGVSTTSNGKLQFTVKVFGATQRLLTEAKNLEEAKYVGLKKQIVTFKVGETSGEIKSFAHEEAKEEDRLPKYDTIKITSISGRTINGDLELNSNAKIYDADREEINLRDLKVGMTITVYFQGTSKRFVDYVIAGEVSKTPETKSGVVTYIKGTEEVNKVVLTEGDTLALDVMFNNTTDKNISVATNGAVIQTVDNSDGSIKDTVKNAADLAILAGKSVKIGSISKAGLATGEYTVLVKVTSGTTVYDSELAVTVNPKKADADAAAAMDAKIEALPTVATLKLTDKTAVTTVNSEYGSMAAAPKALVKKANVDKLAALMKQFDVLAVAKEKADLTVTYNGTDATITLPAATQGTTITWASNSALVNAVTKAVTRPAYGEADATVKLTATIKLNDAVEVKEFTITVKAQGPTTDADKVAVAKAALELDYDGEAATITLPSTGLHSTTISWASNNTAVIDTDGTVVRPAVDTDVVLTATITSGAVSVTKDFTVTVKAQ